MKDLLVVSVDMDWTVIVFVFWVDGCEGAEDVVDGWDVGLGEILQ